MGSEKVKEIKKALEYCSNHSVSDCSNVCPYDKYTRCRTELTKDSLTLINELESENERLNKSDTSKEESSIEYYNLYRDFKRENQTLKGRIAEMEKGNKSKTDTITDLLKNQEFYETEKLKQFAEKLKEKAHKGSSRDPITYKFIERDYTITESELKELLKEYEE